VARVSQAPLSTTYPNSVVVLGHSGATGFNSQASSPGVDYTPNSWATGDNPDVNSIYSRLLALNPAVRGHNTNVAVDGTTVDDLDSQVDQAFAVKPTPDLFLIQTVDNDIRCDGTDQDNYAPFAATLTAVLTKITTRAPKARILLVSSPPGTVANYARVVAHLPGPRGEQTGTGPCDLFLPSGKPALAQRRYQDRVIKRYLGELASVCATFPTCQYDGGALYRMKITTADFTFDGSHLTVSGHRKQAALEWRVLALDH
jgi:hypothetical protein